MEATVAQKPEDAIRGVIHSLPPGLHHIGKARVLKLFVKHRGKRFVGGIGVTIHKAVAHNVYPKGIFVRRVAKHDIWLSAVKACVAGAGI